MIYPGDRPEPLPVMVSLHGLGGDHTTAVDRPRHGPLPAGRGRRRGAALRDRDGGRRYDVLAPASDRRGRRARWSLDELLPILAAQGLHTRHVAFHGWSMGGYGTLRLAGILGAAARARRGRPQPGPVDEPRRRVVLRLRRRCRVRALQRGRAPGRPRRHPGPGRLRYRRPVLRRRPRLRRGLRPDRHQHASDPATTTRRTGPGSFPHSSPSSGTRCRPGYRRAGERPGVPRGRVRRRRRRLPHRLGRPAGDPRTGRRGRDSPTPCGCSSIRRSSPPASARPRATGRPTRVARPSSTSTAAAW